MWSFGNPDPHTHSPPNPYPIPDTDARTYSDARNSHCDTAAKRHAGTDRCQYAHADQERREYRLAGERACRERCSGVDDGAID